MQGSDMNQRTARILAAIAGALAAEIGCASDGEQNRPSGDSNPVLALACVDNSDCGATQYCEYEDGNCGVTGEGTCQDRPADPCRDGGFGMLCGCDGVTYGNTCFSRGTGVNTLHDGACVSDVQSQ